MKTTLCYAAPTANTMPGVRCNGGDGDDINTGLGSHNTPLLRSPDSCKYLYLDTLARYPVSSPS